MPTVDPELIAPLSKISDILLKRPGKVTVEGIKRLSNIYGFETFDDTLTVNENSSSNNMIYSYGSTTSNAGTPMGKNDTNVQIIDRLSLSGKILLLDIDFQNDSVHNVSLSSAVKVQPIDEITYDFLEGYGEFQKVENILLRNLQSKTLDQFNRNLRILSQFDRLSLSAPYDLFNLFNLLAYNLLQVYDYTLNIPASVTERSTVLTHDEKIKDLQEGYYGLGRVLMNQQVRIGLFLKIWEDNRFINRYIFDTKQIKTNQSLHPYLIHFKITENNKLDNDLLDSESLTGSANNAGSSSSNNGLKDEVKMKWFENGEWLINKQDSALISNLNLLVLEFCPNIWIPEDLLIELGLTDYEVITESNEFLNYDIAGYDDKLDEFYKCINAGHYKELRISGELNATKKLKLNFLVGCEFIKLYKIKFNRLDKLVKFVSTIRSWCLLNNLIRNLLNHEISTTTGSSATMEEQQANNGAPKSEENEEENVLELQDDLRLNDIIKENISLVDIQDSNVQQQPSSDSFNNSLCVLSVEVLKTDEIRILYKNIVLKIKDGDIYCDDERIAKIVTKTEELAAVI
ncbi:hypothetical protein CANARDRAFT_5944 [[Candida] arabinofermentans NRRL YB-2248]|uniref:Mediator of RNA polymerase II transcription subunit 1 n=1 Tax=[Candida] arabinofermentans NRRL YB-2248 TaxID=983967 RepID=A0A1E4T6X1_9ASCO|nr:hypothetical protein CANARDRAFT_5944 [[Candida] arabinofermentans NRRL YB-2248]